MKMRGNARFLLTTLCLSILCLTGATALAQTGDGKAGIDKATELVKTYFNAGVILLYVIGGVVGLVGAVKVYNKWSSGDQDTNKAAASWFGACIFLVVVATVLRSFFGITA
jgi:uncharacterized membrane protein YeaQ/YmgE (transglycosylase-associated protein family)